MIYKNFVKRVIDFLLSLSAIIILSPIWIILIVLGSIAMKGNPFFLQQRPGYKEKTFNLIKFRTMSNAKDSNGNLLSNEVRLNKYGRILRSTSLDELPELFNILLGNMSIVGPRPLLPEYIPYYTEEEHHRHDVRPGLTGLAQVNGRNAISSWEERFAYDLEYVNNCSFLLDIQIIIKTALKVVKRSDILVGSTVVVGRLDDIRNNNNK
ncbi:sugar transferase [Longibaculum muris]|uniref:Lipopolysaccharide/colanic/teichoic acid biosynthesis glycosyltransferase n=1 Tax=Longibaculum muris TaxID=1796628 RepID=A0A4V6P4B1_9FIRM|nr:sugar transferase [Longibaculum muris]TCW01038.1 lipopolysaccharide/colanic/teichoic acid biosynthesis glycosyltransferase [Longibaculum muris]